MSAPLQFPQFDPVLLHLGPISIRWYALAYIVGLVTGWQVMRRITRWPPAVATLAQTDDFLTWATLGVVLGGRLGYMPVLPARLVPAPTRSPGACRSGTAA